MVAFRLTQYGAREIALAGLVVTVLCVGLIWGAVAVCPYVATLMVFPVGAWAWVLWFFRDPDRKTPQGPGLFVSPADGRVSDITPSGPEGPLGREGLRIGVFMSVFDVHVNRAPCDGRVETIERRPGAFLDVRKADAFERNESTTIRMTCTHAGKGWHVVVRQVAGLIARRIVTDLAEGQDLTRGQRIGMVKFGSRLELWLPLELVGQVRVRVGAQARAGETVLVEAPKEP